MSGRILEHDFAATKRCRHGTFLYNTNDRFVGRSLDLYGEWCESELDLLKQFIQPGNVVLDVGANIGTHTVCFAKLVTEDGAVLAFEPQRLVHQNLCANIALNGLLNVHTRNVGVSNERTTVRMPQRDPRREFNFACVALKEHPEGDLTDVIRIDDLDLQRRDLIKVDVEGMERQVLEGARETIRRTQPILFVENNTVDGSAAIIRTLISLGYEGYWHISPYFNPQNFFGNRQDVFEEFVPEVNMLCLHRSADHRPAGLDKVSGPEDNWQKAALRMSEGCIPA